MLVNPLVSAHRLQSKKRSRMAKLDALSVYFDGHAVCPTNGAAAEELSAITIGSASTDGNDCPTHSLNSSKIRAEEVPPELALSEAGMFALPEGGCVESGVSWTSQKSYCSRSCTSGRCLG
jgi:hypothetical protein